MALALQCIGFGIVAVAGGRVINSLILELRAELGVCRAHLSSFATAAVAQISDEDNWLNLLPYASNLLQINKSLDEAVSACIQSALNSTKDDSPRFEQKYFIKPFLWCSAEDGIDIEALMG